MRVDLSKIHDSPIYESEIKCDVCEKCKEGTKILYLEQYVSQDSLLHRVECNKCHDVTSKDLSFIIGAH